METPSDRSVQLRATVNWVYRTIRLYWSNGSLRAWARLVSYVARRMAGCSMPWLFTVAPTYRCQCNCVHCFAGVGSRDGGGELTTQELKDVIDQARELGAL